MGMNTRRRSGEHNLRQAVSDILEQTYAIEYSMGLFFRKGTERELERAQEDYEIMRAGVERLGAIIANAHQEEDADIKVAGPTT